MHMPLPPPDHLALEAAQGWLMLGDAASALAELDRISAKHRSDPGVLETECEIRTHAEDWPEAFAVAERLVQAAPGQVRGWILRAYAARRMPAGGLELARSLLQPALERFPKMFLVPYNLACYAARMGQAEEAWRLLQRAMKTGERSVVLRLAIADPDLETIRARLGGTGEGLDSVEPD